LISTVDGNRAMSGTSSVRYRHHAQYQRHNYRRTLSSIVDETRVISDTSTATDITLSVVTTPVSGTGTSTVTGARTISGTSPVPDRKLSQPAKTVSGTETRNNAGAETIAGTSTAIDIKLSVIATHVSGL